MSELHSEISCKYGGLCGGCPWIAIPPATQSEEKIKKLDGLFPPDQVHILRPGLERLRDRVDLTIKRLPDGDRQVGLWSLRTSGVDLKLFERELVDLHECPMMSESLEEWFQLFRTRLPDIELGSVRLRVSASGERGAWLDFSNEDVKNLFEEREYLKWLSGHGIVEIGQRKKTLYFDEDGRPRLKKEVELRPWFQTWDLKGKTYPIYSAIGGFSQSGLKANRVLVQEVLTQVSELKDRSGTDFWLEAFCGGGNFTYPLSQVAGRVLAFENDPIAVQGLQEGLDKERIENVQLERVDLKSERQIERLMEALPKNISYGLLADPPRSGLMKLLNFLEERKLNPEALVYVSCFTESLIHDAQRLSQIGFKLERLSLVDQFPHSPHVEWVSVWFKKN